MSDRMMYMKLDIEGEMMIVISAYAPQVGCLREEKDKFWTDLDEVVESIPKEERLVIGQISMGMLEKETGDENVMGRYGDKARRADAGGFRDKNGNGYGEHVFQKEGGTQDDL